MRVTRDEVDRLTVVTGPYPFLGAVSLLVAAGGLWLLRMGDAGLWLAGGGLLLLAMIMLVKAMTRAVIAIDNQARTVSVTTYHGLVLPRTERRAWSEVAAVNLYRGWGQELSLELRGDRPPGPLERWLGDWDDEWVRTPWLVSLGYACSRAERLQGPAPLARARAVGTRLAEVLDVPFEEMVFRGLWKPV